MEKWAAEQLKVDQLDSEGQAHAADAAGEAFLKDEKVQAKLI